jgi:serine/threonine protein kinase
MRKKAARARRATVYIEGVLESPRFEPLTAGTRIGPYELVSFIGAGGMGQVYKAKDTRLNRVVAIKVLPSANPDRRERFHREAETIAALTHPHICAVYDVGESAVAGVNERLRGADSQLRPEVLQYLVMEYLDGETLAHRLERGALPFDEALKYAIEIADALDKAHCAGIVHRDLKPGNIMLTTGGTKLLDFGLAGLVPRAAASVSSGSGSTTTETLAVTAASTFGGTLPYMAPEQLEGREADERADIWSFGCVIYEMVAGRRPFEGTSQVSTVAAILERPLAPASHLQPLTPPALDHILQECLNKERKARWQNAHDLKCALEWIDKLAVRKSPEAHPNWPRRGAWLTVPLVVAATAWIGLSLVQTRSGSTIGAAIKFTVGSPPNSNLTPPGGLEFAISEDGRELAFIASSAGGTPQLWVRPLSATTARVLAGTESASSPFWSPDGQSIGFLSRGALRVADVSSGAQRTVCCHDARWGIAWNRGGVILFPQSDGLWSIPAGGGAPTQVTALDKALSETSHRWPQFLPDGRHFIFQAFSAEQRRPATYVGALDSTSRISLSTEVSFAFAPPDHLLFMRDDTLMEQRLDLNRFQTVGPSVPLAEKVGHDSLSGAPFVSASSEVLVYRESEIIEGMRLVWVDQRGKQLAVVGPAGVFSDLALSPDETRVAFTRQDPRLGTRDVWILDLARDNWARITRDPANDWLPIWSPDGTRIIFASDRGGNNDLYETPPSGAGPDTLLLRTQGRKWPLDWSRDGQFVLFNDTITPGTRSLWALPMSGDRQPRVVLSNVGDVFQARFSPDGHWIAYTTSEMGKTDVFVTRFPTPGDRSLVSRGGGTAPIWDSGGKALFYLDLHQNLMTAEALGGGQFGVPRPLFPTELPAVAQSGYGADYVVDSHRQRFLVKRVVEESTYPPVSVIVNWTAELKK